MQGVHLTFYVSILQPYSAGGATLGPPDPIAIAVLEEEYKVECILRHRQQGERWNTWCSGIVMIKQRIVGSQNKISFILNRLYTSISLLTGFSENIH